MNREDFTKLTQRHFEEILGINKVKGHDYTQGSEDALANFKVVAEPIGLTPEQVWAVYTGKHWQAVLTFCKEGQVESEPIEGRIHDVILYCFLLLGLIEEKKTTLVQVEREPYKPRDSIEPGKTDRT